MARGLDGARRNAAAIAKEEVRSQGPPRRATVIRASRTLPETFPKNTKPRYYRYAPSNFHSRQYGFNANLTQSLIASPTSSLHSTSTTLSRVMRI